MTDEQKNKLDLLNNDIKNIGAKNRLNRNDVPNNQNKEQGTTDNLWGMTNDEMRKWEEYGKRYDEWDNMAREQQIEWLNTKQIKQTREY